MCLNSKAGLVSVPSTVTSPEKGCGRVVSDVLPNTQRKPNTTVLYHKLLVASMQKCPHQIKMIEQIEK